MSISEPRQTLLGLRTAVAGGTLRRLLVLALAACSGAPERDARSNDVGAGTGASAGSMAGGGGQPSSAGGRAQSGGEDASACSGGMADGAVTDAGAFYASGDGDAGDAPVTCE